MPNDPKQAAEVIRANHERANNLVLATQTVEAHDGQFTATAQSSRGNSVAKS